MQYVDEILHTRKPVATLPHRLRLLRKHFGLSQRQVAEYLGLHRSTYTYYESGASVPHISTLYRLSCFYGVTTDYLLGFDQDDAPFRPLDPSAE